MAFEGRDDVRDVTQAKAIGGLIKIQEVDQALNLFRELCSRGHCPDVVAYNILIRGLCKANRVIEAENLLDEIVERGLSPSVVTYNLFIDSWCKNGSIDKAMALLSRMSEEDREPNVITYSTLVDGLCRAERPDDALLVWNQMETKGQLQYFIIDKTLAKDIMNSPCSFTPGALGFFIRCLGSIGLVQEANEVFDEMEMKGLCFENRTQGNADDGSRSAGNGNDGRGGGGAGCDCGGGNRPVHRTFRISLSYHLGAGGSAQDSGERGWGSRQEDLD
ncbi:putative pentatricopeptide repeat-containing protein At5g08310, mitochondrial [Gastrolobium bilobum]|uniref:putative pentatricopeptide repeat-containing protein At5g08310, mitochondrial n=1 Tax=Gastrolobium bilobum TaxID=150636 RepID=UPI002AB00916|nr:putative pentatricopeptide repeat-containing protein At5g08310, mitochondrial [Gastrolobium bilobum]